MIKILAIIFVILIILVGEERGVKALLSLIGNILVLIFAVFSMAKGYNAILIAIISSYILSIITLFLQNGVNHKTKSAFIAVQIVVLLMISGALLVGKNMAISGYNDLEVYEEEVMYLSDDININMIDVEVAIIIFGLLGAIIDTGIAISTAVYEVHRNNKQLTRVELFKSGIVMGKDIIGTTANTLFFTCIGESMMMYHLFKTFNYSFVKVINSKAFFQQFVFTIFGGIGCVIIIPISAWVISYMITRNKDVEVKNKSKLNIKINLIKK